MGGATRFELFPEAIDKIFDRVVISSHRLLPHPFVQDFTREGSPLVLHKEIEDGKLLCGEIHVFLT